MPGNEKLVHKTILTVIRNPLLQLVKEDEMDSAGTIETDPAAAQTGQPTQGIKNKNILPPQLAQYIKCKEHDCL